METTVTTGRARRTNTKQTSYNEIDSDDEDEKFKAILGYESGSDDEFDLQGHEGDSSDDDERYNYDG